ncbi:MAG: hypothetical protein JWO38_2555 [Gemmataceae bacterium]|nr:hypothetical protein [Gemmataceae bacterium]
MVVGVGLGALAAESAGLTRVSPLVLVVVAVCLGSPAAADVLAQVALGYPSHSRRRLLTGVLLGLGIVPVGRLITVCGERLGQLPGGLSPDRDRTKRPHVVRSGGTESRLPGRLVHDFNRRGEATPGSSTYRRWPGDGLPERRRQTVEDSLMSDGAAGKRDRVGRPRAPRPAESGGSAPGSDNRLSGRHSITRMAGLSGRKGKRSRRRTREEWAEFLPGRGSV